VSFLEVLAVDEASADGECRSSGLRIDGGFNAVQHDYGNCVRCSGGGLRGGGLHPLGKCHGQWQCDGRPGDLRPGRLGQWQHGIWQHGIGGTAHFNLIFLPANSASPVIDVQKLVITPPNDYTQAEVTWNMSVLLQDAATHPGTYISPVIPGA
jgi:hypothetical protein